MATTQTVPVHHTPKMLQEDMYAAILSNQALMLSLLACAVAQIAKVFTHWYVEHPCISFCGPPLTLEGVAAPNERFKHVIPTGILGNSERLKRCFG
eukprot:6932763-Pyramimonas_sp.AAC.1